MSIKNEFVRVTLSDICVYIYIANDIEQYFILNSRIPEFQISLGSIGPALVTRSRDPRTLREAEHIVTRG